MPYDEADETDPMMLVGVQLPSGEEAAIELARTIADEYSRMGFDEEKIIALFRNPFYAGAHRAFLALGEERVRAEVRERTRLWGRVRYRDRDADTGGIMLTLPVLDRGSETESREEG